MRRARLPAAHAPRSLAGRIGYCRRLLIPLLVINWGMCDEHASGLVPQGPGKLWGCSSSSLSEQLLWLAQSVMGAGCCTDQPGQSSTTAVTHLAALGLAHWKNRSPPCAPPCAATRRPAGLRPAGKLCLRRKIKGKQPQSKTHRTQKIARSSMSQFRTSWGGLICALSSR
jgi:hypothetical protein